MDQLTVILKVMSALAWATVFLRLLPSVRRTLARRAHYYDVLWSLVGCVGLMVLGFNLRSLVIADNLIVYLGLYVFSILLGFAMLAAVHAYQHARND